MWISVAVGMALVCVTVTIETEFVLDNLFRSRSQILSYPDPASPSHGVIGLLNHHRQRDGILPGSRVKTSEYFFQNDGTIGIIMEDPAALEFCLNIFADVVDEDATIMLFVTRNWVIQLCICSLRG